MDDFGNERGAVSDEQLERVMASQKSYVGASVVVFLLYWCFWIPGLIFNIMWRNEAIEIKKLTGRTPAGLGCLNLMFIIAIAPLVILGGCMVTALGLGAAGVATEAVTPSSTPQRTPAPVVRQVETPRPTPRPTTTPEVRTSPAVVTSIAELKPGVAYQLKQDRQLSTERGDVVVRAGDWVRIDRVEQATFNTIAEVEARSQDGTVIGRGFMTFGGR